MRSPLEEFLPGQRFKRVLLDEPTCESPADATRILICSGRLWVDLLAARDDMGEAGNGIGILRIEQIAPFPFDLVASTIERYPNAELCWVQEEPLNYGAWGYVRPRIELLTAEHSATADGATTHASAQTAARSVRYIGRRPSAAPATGLLELHKAEQENLLREAMSIVQQK